MPHRTLKPWMYGFTLIEMIVVLTVISLIGGLVVARRPWHSARIDQDGVVRALAGALQLARSRAIVLDRDVRVTTATRSFSVDDSPPRMIAADVAMSEAVIVFTPDGSSNGGTILVSAADRRAAISIDWLTGRVRTTDLPAQAR